MCLRTISWNSFSYAMSPDAAICEVRISLSVMPPSAETTTMTGSCCDSTICLTLNMLWMEPTEVPPNFITFMSVYNIR